MTNDNSASIRVIGKRKKRRNLFSSRVGIMSFQMHFVKNRACETEVTQLQKFDRSQVKLSEKYYGQKSNKFRKSYCIEI